MIPLPDKKYNLIYGDPPWKYDFQECKSRMIENHYPTMLLEEIIKIPVQDITNDDCVLFLWTTSPKLKEGLEVIESWGFDYKTHCIWDKLLIGTGYWFRGRHELLLVGTKGSPGVPLPHLRVPSVYKEQRKKHSQKPGYFYSLLESFELNPKIELFAREQREGWDVWGNQTPKTMQMILNKQSVICGE